MTMNLLLIQDQIKHLQIVNLPRSIGPFVSQLHLSRVLVGLKTLELSLSNVELDCTNVRQWLSPASRSYFATFPGIWLRPATNLTALVLGANFLWGFDPKVDFSGINLPFLQTLVLRNFVFFDEWVFSWLSKHSNTLLRFYIDSCPLLVNYPILRSSILWSDYFRFFAEHLTQLRLFEFRHKDSLSCDPTEDELSEPTSSFVIRRTWVNTNTNLSKAHYITLWHGAFHTPELARFGFGTG